MVLETDENNPGDFINANFINVNNYNFVDVHFINLSFYSGHAIKFYVVNSES